MQKRAARRYEVFSDLFVNLSAGAFASVFLFPGIFGVRSFAEILVLLFFNIPLGIVFLLTALRFKEFPYA